MADSLEFIGISKEFGNVKALNDITLETQSKVDRMLQLIQLTELAYKCLIRSVRVTKVSCYKSN